MSFLEYQDFFPIHEGFKIVLNEGQVFCIESVATDEMSELLRKRKEVLSNTFLVTPVVVKIHKDVSNKLRVKILKECKPSIKVSQTDI
mmetsp:Transcript_35876/g.55063  ORF Transcript_35876/g.55063 Transcript_35876/m.55063 type:complete len:88 (+) Transcript_35876:1663-1926(+)|eukprot:CAMPEP_0170500562 /NCGR_PEP_ID=MMETSP0208-20121228/35285_1 /TAXON_ID=197538 /ORGANISM="Strombidium inclinatum, Strain S3" /LENGTH=87 /DNA_ID=CAMNT_0010778661 /DNA_START=1627 /DNA_END=1890 /DNA_ORIENTATION=-